MRGDGYSYDLGYQMPTELPDSRIFAAYWFCTKEQDDPIEEVQIDATSLEPSSEWTERPNHLIIPDRAESDNRHMSRQEDEFWRRSRRRHYSSYARRRLISATGMTLWQSVQEPRYPGYRIPARYRCAWSWALCCWEWDALHRPGLRELPHQGDRWAACGRSVVR